MNKLNRISAFFLLAVSFLTQPVLADFSGCVKTDVVSGDACGNLQVRFDFSKCEPRAEAMTRTSSCWNNKGVTVAKLDGKILTATFEKKSGKWTRTGLREISSGSSTSTATAAAVTTATPQQAAAISVVEAAEAETRPHLAIKPTIPAKAETSAVAATPGPTAPMAPPAEEKPHEAAPVAKQVADEGIKVTGLIDFSYVYNTNKPAPVAAPAATSTTVSNQPAANNAYRMFDIYHDDPAVALAELTLQKKKGDVAGLLSLDYGQQADVSSANDGVSKNFSQALITYTPHQVSGLSMTFGKMFSHMGLESPKSKEDWNYSRSLTWAYGLPLWHEGMAINYNFIQDHLDGGFYIYNKNSGLYQTNRNKTLGAQLNWTITEGYSLVYNGISGVEDLNGMQVKTVHEIIGKANFNSAWAFAFDVIRGNQTKANADGSDAKYTTWSAAFKWTHGFFSLSPRYEVFDDPDGFFLPLGPTAVAIGQRMDSSTLTASFDAGDGLEFRLEGRQDHSNYEVFLQDGNTKKTQMTYTGAVLYGF